MTDFSPTIWMEACFMEEREFYLPSSDRNYRIHCMEWIPEGDVYAVLQLVHGMIEHAERYREFAVWMAEHGVAVLGHDHLGHGKTAVNSEDFGYFGTDGGSVCLIKDISRVTVYGKKRYPGKKLFLLGHSMGSFLVRRYISVYGNSPDGMILLGTGAPPEGFVFAGYLLASTICRLEGERYRSSLLYEMSLGNYNRKFRPTKTSFDWLTREEAYAKSFEEDDLCQFVFTAGAYRDFFRLILADSRAEKAGRMRTDMPVLILAGDRDPVGEEAVGVRRVCSRYEKAGVKDMTLGVYQGARHELLHETNRMEVFEDIYSWLQDQIGE